MAKQIFRSFKPGLKTHFHINKTAHNFWYLIRHKRTNQFMAKRAKTFNLEHEIKHYKTILIRNNEDPWLTPDLSRLKQLNPHLAIERLDGEHDDCWLHPNRYIDLLEKHRNEP